MNSHRSHLFSNGHIHVHTFPVAAAPRTDPVRKPRFCECTEAVSMGTRVRGGRRLPSRPDCGRHVGQSCLPGGPCSGGWRAAPCASEHGPRGRRLGSLARSTALRRPSRSPGSWPEPRSVWVLLQEESEAPALCLRKQSRQALHACARVARMGGRALEWPHPVQSVFNEQLPPPPLFYTIFVADLSELWLLCIPE